MKKIILFTLIGFPLTIILLFLPYLVCAGPLQQAHKAVIGAGSTGGGDVTTAYTGYQDDTIDAAKWASPDTPSAQYVLADDVTVLRSFSPSADGNISKIKIYIQSASPTATEIKAIWYINGTKQNSIAFTPVTGWNEVDMSGGTKAYSNGDSVYYGVTIDYDGTMAVGRDDSNAPANYYSIVGSYDVDVTIPSNHATRQGGLMLEYTY